MQTAIISSGLSLISSHTLTGLQIRSWYLHCKCFPNWWERPLTSQKVGHGSVLIKRVRYRLWNEAESHHLQTGALFQVYLQAFCIACRPITYVSTETVCRYIFITQSRLVSAKHRENTDSGATIATETPESRICLLLILSPLASCSLWRTNPPCQVVFHGDPLAVVFVRFQKIWQNCHRRSLEAVTDTIWPNS